jgi:hypothetical protein
MMSRSADQFIQDALRNRHNQAILQRLPALALPDCWLVAGCLFQSVWNLKGGRPPETGIKDYDLFYCDTGDLSEAGEQAVNTRVQDCFADLGVDVEIKNQARVHLWYADYFGHPYSALHSSKDGMDRFLVKCTCVGLRPYGQGSLELYAPNGLDDLYDGVLEGNPRCNHVKLFDAKAASYRARWAWLTVKRADEVTAK